MGFFDSVKESVGRQVEKNRGYRDNARGMSDSELRNAYNRSHDSCERYIYAEEAKKRREL